MEKQDRCQIEVQGEMTQERLAAFSMLYYPLIGRDAFSLYHILLALGTRQQRVRNHLLLEKLSGQTTAQWEQNRHILEQYLLLKTYYCAEEHRYLYQLYMPKGGHEFLRHEVFGRLYMKQMGKQVYEFAKLCFTSSTHDHERYLDITAPFVNLLQNGWQEKEEAQFMKSKPQADRLHEGELPLAFNFDRFLHGFSTAVFPLSARNERNLRSIAELASIHGIDELTMRKLVSQSMNLKDNTLNLEMLRKKVHRIQKDVPAANQDPYALPPVLFLQQKQHGVAVSTTDKKLIEELIEHFCLRPEVVNVLIEYVLQRTQQKFHRSYVEKVAGEWVRLRIDSKAAAFQHIQAEDQQKQARTPASKKKELPPWFHDQELVQAADVEVDDEELQQLMKKLGGEA